jgi:hypothetical protein
MLKAIERSRTTSEAVLGWVSNEGLLKRALCKQ